MERVLQRIEQQFVGDQAKQNALVEIERNAIGGNIKPSPCGEFP